jgi:UDP-N-acetylmuramoyl-tripeptide--D-alanyl-D-alanine ligase
MHWTESGFQNQMRVSYRERQFDVQLSLAGRHNLMNALAAIAVALGMGCDEEQIQMGLASVSAVDGRLRLLRSPAGWRLIDDSYNANPDSVDAAIDVLRNAPGKRYLVLGDLAELGEGAERMHGEIGERAKQAGLDHLFSQGQLCREAVQRFGAGGEFFSGLDELVDALSAVVRSGDTVLVKGSRSAGMDRVVDRLMGVGRG